VIGISITNPNHGKKEDQMLNHQKFMNSIKEFPLMMELKEDINMETKNIILMESHLKKTKIEIKKILNDIYILFNLGIHSFYCLH
jgi:hypothetical protein